MTDVTWFGIACFGCIALVTLLGWRVEALARRAGRHEADATIHPRSSLTGASDRLPFDEPTKQGFIPGTKDHRARFRGTSVEWDIKATGPAADFGKAVTLASWHDTKPLDYKAAGRHLWEHGYTPMADVLGNGDTSEPIEKAHWGDLKPSSASERVQRADGGALHDAYPHTIANDSTLHGTTATADSAAQEPAPAKPKRQRKAK